jgi:curli biogenesis system outer membrane secretion channel CsgG
MALFLSAGTAVIAAMLSTNLQQTGSFNGSSAASGRRLVGVLMLPLPRHQW